MLSPQMRLQGHERHGEGQSTHKSGVTLKVHGKSQAINLMISISSPH